MLSLHDEKFHSHIEHYGFRFDGRFGHSGGCQDHFVARRVCRYSNYRHHGAKFASDSFYPKY